VVIEYGEDMGNDEIPLELSRLPILQINHIEARRCQWFGQTTPSHGPAHLLSNGEVDDADDNVIERY